MSSLTDTAEQAFLDLLFLNTDWANVGDAAGLQNSAAAGSFWVSLLESDPTEAGLTTGESTYTSYARVQLNRTGGVWSRTGSVISNAATVSFPASTGGTSTVTHYGLHTASSGSGNMIAYGTLASSRTITSGNTPQFAAGQLSFTGT